MEDPLARPLDEPGAGDKKLVYGNYGLPLRIEQDELLISVEREGDNLLYHREGAGETVDKIILAGEGRVAFNPVEPVNKPKEITSFFLIQFEQTLAIKPRETKDVFVTFPVEIVSLFLEEKDSYAVLDIFCLTSPKYTLYGTPKNGLICRYWQSEVYSIDPPAPDPLQAGVMRLNMRNTTSRWVETTQAVFSANDTKIYYNQNSVFTDGYMKILSETTAETGFGNTPPAGKELEKSVELRSTKKTIMTGAKLVMEEGI